MQKAILIYEPVGADGLDYISDDIQEVVEDIVRSFTKKSVTGYDEAAVQVIKKFVWEHMDSVDVFRVMQGEKQGLRVFGDAYIIVKAMTESEFNELPALEGQE